VSIFNVFLVFQEPLHWLIVTLTDLTLNYGLAIVLFTLIIRTVLAPLYVMQIRSSRKMMQLSPKLKQLQKKHGKDREALTRETMALYKEYNHNPALGCVLPLVQLPILWSLFLVLRDIASHPPALHHDLYASGFLWLTSLGHPDQLHILPIVAGITQWITQRMMLQPTSDPQQRQVNQIMQFLPAMIVVFAWAYPSGLAVYWVISNFYMMALQFYISGWGQLFTSPFTVPSGPAPSPERRPTATPRRDDLTEAQVMRVTGEDAPAAQPPEDLRASAEREAASKMERYQVRHGRSVARGRPSAKGAKK
jgi:YidC/Oxa1 family membrane protein insertase